MLMGAEIRQRAPCRPGEILIIAEPSRSLPAPGQLHRASRPWIFAVTRGRATGSRVRCTRFQVDLAWEPT